VIAGFYENAKVHPYFTKHPTFCPTEESSTLIIKVSYGKVLRNT